MTIPLAIILLAVGLVVYAYVGYPLLVRVLAGFRRPISGGAPAEDRWPGVSFSIPVYNEEGEVRRLLDSILAIDYPPDRLEIVVVSDASTDGTDDIVREYADRGVRLVRLPTRQGKTAAEAAAAREITNEIVINTDASIRIAPDALKPIVKRFADGAVGVVSGCDVSIARAAEPGGSGEAAYVGYEMKIRDAETRLHGIVGASGCFYGIRRDLHLLPLRPELSRDFAAALHAEEHGYRAVSAPEAICYVPRTTDIQREYRRKVRTIRRGMHTLWHKRHLLNPLRRPVFAWMLFSHKVCRWLVPWMGVAALLALAALALSEALAAALLALACVGIATGAIGWFLSRTRSLPRGVSLLAYALAGNVAAMHALIALLVSGGGQAVWEPTRREAGAR